MPVRVPADRYSVGPKHLPNGVWPTGAGQRLQGALNGLDAQANAELRSEMCRFPYNKERSDLKQCSPIGAKALHGLRFAM